VADPLESMRARYPTLDQWFLRLGRGMVPVVGSPLAGDDAAWTPQPLSACAQGCLASAWDHLQAVRVLTEAGSLHPLATFSLTRGALLASSTAVWMLAPTSAEARQARGMAYARESLTHRQQWNRDAAATPVGIVWRNLAVVQRHVAMRLHGLDLHQSRTHARKLPAPTELVMKAARVAFADNAPMGALALLHWRSTSSDAHGLMWGSLTRGPVPGAASGALHEFGIGGDEVQTAEHFHVAFLMARWAWNRLDELNV
jgi:hypothetical protein